MTSRARILGYGAALLLLALLVWLALRPERIAVDLATVRIGPLQETVVEEGRTRARHRHVVTAPVAGRVERLALEVGDSVVPGATVARLAPVALDPRSREQARAALRASQDLEAVAASAVTQARAVLQQARDERARAERLLPSGGIARAEVERLQLAERAREADLAAGEARLRAAGHDVQAARAALAAAGAPGGQVLAVTCPIGGRVLALPDRSARTVAPGEVLLEVGDPSDLEIVADFLSTDAVRVSPGDRMLVRGWGGDGSLEARVLRVEPAGFTKVSALGVEEQRVNVIGTFEAAPARLGDGFRVEVHVVLWEEPEVLQVPASALFRRGEDWTVYVVEEGRARERQVTVGHESGSSTQILEGLREGDTVIRHPSDRVEEGVRVRGRE